MERLEERTLLSGTPLGSLVALSQEQSAAGGEPAALLAGGLDGSKSVSIPTDLIGAPGSTVTVPINIDDAAGLTNVKVTLAFDTALLDVLEVRAGAVWPETGTIVTPNVDEAAGEIIVSVIHAPPLPAGSGAGSVVDVDFQIAPNPASNTATIDLRPTSYFNEESFDPAPVAGDDPTDGLITFAEEGGGLDVSLVHQRTPVDPVTGEVGALPASEPWIDGWDTFWVEIWGNTPGPADAGIAAASVDLEYDTARFSATAIEFGPAFTEDRTGSIDDGAGVVADVAAATTLTDVGDDGLALLARVRFEPIGADQAAVDVASRFAGPYDLGLALSDAQMELTDTTVGNPELGDPPDTELWAVVYDYDHSNKIDFGDLAWFASVFLGPADEPDAWWADYNQDGFVDFGDLAELAPNFLHQRPDDGIEFSANFPDAWRLAETATDVALQQAVDGDADVREDLFANPAWCCEFEQLQMKQRPAKKDNPAEGATDTLLATFRP